MRPRGEIGWRCRAAGEDPAESDSKPAGMAGLHGTAGLTVRVRPSSFDFPWISLAFSGNHDSGSGEEVWSQVMRRRFCVRALTSKARVFEGLPMRFASAVISFLLAVLIPGLFCSSASAGQGCCGGAAAPRVFVPIAMVPVQPVVPMPALPAPAPCCGGPVVQPATMYPSAIVVPPGHHVSHPYYNYRAPWNVPGPAVVNRSITW